MAVAVEDQNQEQLQTPLNYYTDLKKGSETMDQLDFSKTGSASQALEENNSVMARPRDNSQSISLPSTSAHLNSTWERKVHCFVASSRQEVLNDDDFNQNLKRALEAIKAGIQPLRIAAGSSGSYFVRDINNQYIAVFKPKDEEPFAPQNPKWPKYFQRVLCFCCFGRACLIPNNGYLSETGASLIDEKLQLHIVPKTRVVKLASPAFYYKGGKCSKNKEPKGKDGSYQLFVNGYVSACDIVPHWTKEGTICPLSAEEIERFKYLFQKLCVLDYVIRNTDRHMENWLIKYEPGKVMELAAIDNGLAFPVKHPETASRLRQFPFAWAQLSWANYPWNEELRTHLLELLSPQFVQSLCDDVTALFKYDRDVNRFLKYSQLRVLRGQIWNLRLALMMNEPPAEMVKRPLVLVSRRYRRHPPDDDWNRAFRDMFDALHINEMGSSLKQGGIIQNVVTIFATDLDTSSTYGTGSCLSGQTCFWKLLRESVNKVEEVRLSDMPASGYLIGLLVFELLSDVQSRSLSRTALNDKDF